MIIETYNIVTKKWTKREIDADDLQNIPQDKIQQLELSQSIEKVVDIYIAKDFGENLEDGCPTA